MLRHVGRDQGAEDGKAPLAALSAVLARAGFMPADVPFLQPADVFVEFSGEDIRRRLLLTADADGNEWCLRPEFTIPAARAYLQDGAAGERRDLAFIGPVFRQRPGENGEFRQAGIESIGRTDREAADGELLAVTCEAVAALGHADPRILLGDLELVTAFQSALGLGEALKRRLQAALVAGNLPQLIRGSAHVSPAGLARYPGVLSALRGADATEARAFVVDLLSLAGIHTVGGRTPQEIAERFLREADGMRETLSAEQRGLIERFFAVSGDPDVVTARLRRFARESGIDLGAAIDRFEARIGFMAARGVDVAAITASPAFVRGLDYYSGFVFEMRASGSEGPPLAGGGRYDTLLERLGSPRPVPAVGAAIWLDRFPAPVTPGA